MKIPKPKIVIPLVVFVVGLAVAYEVTAKATPVARAKVAGTVYVLPQDFLINLSDGEFAKLAVGLVLAPGQSDGASAASGSAQDANSQEDIGTLPEEALIRAIVTNILTNQSSTDLLDQSSREQVEAQILTSIRKYTDVKVSQVFFPDLTVQ
ncbi:MAG: flagellar basal body-associated FliL family protein [Solirubrobacteraceae bacterium]|jgi:flagellar FliL protein